MNISSPKELKKFAEKINKVILPGDFMFLYGEIGTGKTTFSRFLINNQLNLSKISKIKKTLDRVIDILWNDISKNNDKVTIIFAPACTSFDQFENFEKRGAYFNQLIFKKIKQ